MRLHLLKHEKRKKNSLKFKMAPESKMDATKNFDQASTEFHFFHNASLRSFCFAITKLL
jgi:hypothetical protein